MPINLNQVDKALSLIGRYIKEQILPIPALSSY